MPAPLIYPLQLSFHASRGNEPTSVGFIPYTSENR